MASQSTLLTFDTIRSLASASMTGSFMAIGTALSFPCRIVKIVNGTSEDVSISIDGVNTHDFVPSGGFTLYDSGTNRGTSSPSLDFPKGMQFFASSASGTGTVYLV